MPYTAEINRANPSCFLFLIDQSGSMQEVRAPATVQAMNEPMVVEGKTYTHTASGRTKAQEVADVINRLLQNLVLLCARKEGVRDYFHIGVIGYGGDNTANRVGPAFAGSLAGKDLAPISEIANNHARIEERAKQVEDGAGGLVEQKIKFPIWFDPVCNGGTPMCQALAKAHSILSSWTAQHPASFPPVVINVTDGEATDGDPTAAAESIRSLATNDGAVLLFMCHISSQPSAAIEYPDTDSILPDQYAKLMFRLSSTLTPKMRETARELYRLQVSDSSRGFVLNGDMVSLIKFLDIGTKGATLR